MYACNVQVLFVVSLFCLFFFQSADNMMMMMYYLLTNVYVCLCTYVHDRYNIYYKLFCVVLGLWNYVFLFSFLSLFVLLPFAYLFTESEGLFGHRKKLIARAYETFVVLALLSLALFGLTYVISALIDKEKSSIQTVLGKF